MEPSWLRLLIKTLGFSQHGKAAQRCLPLGYTIKDYIYTTLGCIPAAVEYFYI